MPSDLYLLPSLAQVVEALELWKMRKSFAALLVYPTTQQLLFTTMK